MGRFWKILFFPLVVFLCIPGAIHKKPAPRLPVVDRVDVICHRGKATQQLHYTDPEKMESVLNYLRLQENLGEAETDPERVIGDAYTVHVEMSDGQRHIYQQRADRYFSRDYHPWQKIDPEQGSAFYDLLGTLPSD